MMRPAAGWVRGWRWCGGEFGVGFCVVLVCFAAAGVAAGWQRRLRSVESALGTAVLDAGSLAGGEVVCG